MNTPSPPHAGRVRPRSCPSRSGHRRGNDRALANARAHSESRPAVSDFATAPAAPSPSICDVVHQWPSPRLTETQPQIGGLAANLVFDGIESADPGQCLGRCRRCVDNMDLVELAASVCPAGNFIDRAIAVEMMEPGIGVGLQAALEVLQMLPWMLALAILRVREPDSRRSIFAGGPVIAHISPETPGFRLATARRKHRHRRIVGVKLGSGEHMLLNRIDQRSEQLARSTDPSGQRGALDLNSLASVDLRLAIERQDDRRTSKPAHGPAGLVRQGHARSGAMAQEPQPRAHIRCRRTSAARGESP